MIKKEIVELQRVVKLLVETQSDLLVRVGNLTSKLNNFCKQGNNNYDRIRLLKSELRALDGKEFNSKINHCGEDE